MVEYRLRSCIGIALILALFFSPRLTAAQDEEYDEYEPQSSVYWHITMDAQGKARTDLTLIKKKDGPDLPGVQQELAAALQESLRCTLENVKHETDRYGVRVDAECAVPVQKDGLVISALIRPSAMRTFLEKHGQFRIDLTITTPKLGISRVAGKEREFSYGGRTTHSLSFRPEERNIGDLPVEFGYRASYVTALVATSAFLLIAPVVLILIIRRRSLLLAGKDPTAAWFGYWRVHRWLAEGIWVAWIIAVSVFSIETFIEHLSGREQPVLNALVLFLPPGIVSFLCQYLSRPLWLQVRGVAWNRREMLVKGFWEHAAAILPLVLIIIGIGSLFQRPGTALLWFAGALIAKLVGAWMHGKISKTMPRTLHGGELREKILEIAQRAGVKIQQVFLMPSKQLQMGNAFALQGRRVMITDYLLERLTKKETDCVMAHEIGHVKMRHTFSLSWVGALVLFAACYAALWGASLFGPSFLPLWVKADPGRMFRVQGWINEYLLFPLALLFAVLARYFLSRRYERSADEFATLVTGDPESMITALVKLSKMNLMPIAWGNWDERLATHPSTIRRAKAIAGRHRIPEDRLRALLETPASRGEGEGYAVPDEVTNTGLVYSTEFKAQKTLVISLLLLLTVSATPLLWGQFVRSAGLPAAANWAGVVLMPLVFLAVANHGSLLGYRKIQRGMREKAAGLGLDPDDERCYFVGLSPETHPRAYENHTVWDIGFLSVTDDSLAYFGDRVSFRILREQVTSITRGAAFPGWIAVAETYIRWREAGTERILHLHSIDGSAMTTTAKRSKALLLDLMNWKDGRLPGRPAAAAERALNLPDFPDVHGTHPRQAVTLQGALTSLAFVAFLVFGLSGVFALDSSLAWYGFGMSSWALFFGILPSIRYKEMP